MVKDRTWTTKECEHHKHVNETFKAAKNMRHRQTHGATVGHYAQNVDGKGEHTRAVMWFVVSKPSELQAYEQSKAWRREGMAEPQERRQSA